MKAAYTLFCEQGYAATTMAQIADAAGVAIQPTGLGEIDFYCSVPGHVAAGMVGTLTIE